MRKSQLHWKALVLVGMAGPIAYAAAPPAASADFFESKIRPVLATSCFPCHSASALGGLRLDSRQALLKGGATGPALTPGDPDKSLLIEAVRQSGDLKMPKGGKLKKEEIAALEEWVKAGAVWPDSPAPLVSSAPAKGYVITPEQRAFWSFQPLKHPEIPQVKDVKWAKTDIDRFILARLDQEGLTPVRPADRRTLIRRATLDLTGLQPTPEEIEAFEKDKSADAFAKVVDRLLESPHYGERWARMWMDVARFGEDDYRSLEPSGAGRMHYPNAYLYRDWLIKAFNNDLPFDKFVKAQLAADRMDETERAKMLPALGFLGLGPWYYDNGAVEVTRADERHDRVDAVTRGFLGLTVACARCHDHKYDPIPTKDYYALSGVFASVQYHEYPMAPKKVVEDYKILDSKLRARNEMLSEVENDESMHLAETLALQASKYMLAAYQVTGPKKVDFSKAVEENKLDFELLDRWVRFLAKPPKFYPYLEKWQAMIKAKGTPEEAQRLADEFQTTLLDTMFERREMKKENEVIVAKALPGTKKKIRNGKPNEFVTNDDFCPGCGLELKTLPLDKMNLWTDVFAFDLESLSLMFQYADMKSALLSFRGWGLERQLSAEKRAYIEGLRDEIKKLKESMPPEYPYAHGVEDLEKPVNLKVSLRGSPYNLGDEAPRHFLSVLSEKPLPLDQGSGRMQLAEDIVKQPIATRVFVNRIWKAHFGTGIVDSPSNFGQVGRRPTHPELLDYLAGQFIESGMSTKKLHRMIMLSSVYQLSGDYSETNYAKDSGNQFYWRMSRKRLDAEEIRDSLIQISGALDGKLYGPSEELKPEFNRRTIYGKVSRYKLDTYLALFDFPSPSASAEQRFSTNVPLQRLFFMNSDFVQQQAELIARKVSAEPTQTIRIQKVYRLIFGRAPNPEELQAGLEYLRTEPLREYDEEKARKEEKPATGANGTSPDASATAGQGPKTDYQPDPVKNPAVEATGGMMAGVYGGTPKEEAAKMLPVTVWGRYAKLLLSSSEFYYAN
jgi:hypothetical protein